MGEHGGMCPGWLLQGRPGSEARWILGGRWKRLSGSPGPLRRGLSGVWGDRVGFTLTQPPTFQLGPNRSGVLPAVSSLYQAALQAAITLDLAED